MARRERLAVGAVLLLALALAWRARFVLDDAFISFQYARSLVEGEGLTWFGARVEGYSNFGWVLWLALGLRLGLDPIAWSQGSGIVAFLAATVLLWRIAERAAARGRFVAAIAVLGFVTNFSVHSFATSGLATMVQTALVLGAFHAVQLARADESAGTRPLAVASLCAALALLVRLDSAALLAPVGVWALSALGTVRRENLRAALVALCGPVSVLVGSWFIWKTSYYGALLPNSFAAKVPGFSGALDGSLQWWRFVLWYQLAPAVGVLGVIAIVRGVRPDRAERESLAVSAVILVCSFVYLTGVGGDFMEFRFLVPVSPYAYLGVALLFGLVCQPLGRGVCALLAVGLVIGLAASSAIHRASFHTDPDLRMDGLAQLGDFYGLYPDGDWERIGAALAREFAGADPVIAVTAAGAIPYYSRLESVDLWGLNDRKIPTLGLGSHYRRPGHHYRAPFAYLRERGVNLIVGSPTLLTVEQLGAIGNMAPLLREFAAEATPVQPSGPRWLEVVAMPVEPDTRLLLWMFESTPAIDQIARGWRRWRVPYRDPKLREKGPRAPK